MKPALLLLSAWLLSGCVTLSSRTSDSRDYAITTCEAKPQEIELVQRRARNYLARHPSSAAEVRFLAVEADSVFPSEVQDLWIKLRRSQTATSAYVQYKDNYVRLSCVLFVDRSTQLPLTSQGYVLADTRHGERSLKSGVIVHSILEHEAPEFSNCLPSEMSS
jgi:hypothetical protein